MKKPLEDRIASLKRKYRLNDPEIVIDGEVKLIRKTGIKKIKDKELIDVQIDQAIVRTLSTKIGVEDAVYLTGTGLKKNRKGFVIDQEVDTASATPFNCSFNYKMEVATSRLKSRLVLTLAGLSDFLSEDELNIVPDRTNGSKSHPSQDADDALIKSALDKMNKNVR